MDIVLLIPAYQPDDKMIALLSALSAQREYARILVVDDGSGAEYGHLFERAEKIEGVRVLRHGTNCGKGRALKTGLNEALLSHPGAGVVTADCDGQHSPEDIFSVANTLRSSPKSFIVGGRAFKGHVPLKSRAGNAAMRLLFHLSTGRRVYDTQTGLRGIPPHDIAREALIPGERYEYEMNVLLSLAQTGIAIKEIPIQTIYIDENKGSHFHPLRDAMRVFNRMIAFASASIISLGIDYGIYVLMDLFVPFFPPMADYATARGISSLFNFILNRQIVFRAHGSLPRQLLAYYALAICLIGAGTFLVGWLTSFGMNRYAAKLLVDAALYVISFFTQRFVVFPSRCEKL